MFALTPIALALFGLPAIVSTPPASIVAAGAYATGLASVANGATFGLRSADDKRLFVYKRVDSATADLIGVQPYTNRSAIDSVISAIQGMPMAVTPVLDFDTIYAYYGLREFGNLAAGSPGPTLNQLAGMAGSLHDFYTTGGVTAAPSAGSSDGGSNGIRMQVPVAATANSYLFSIATVLPGRWVLAFDARCNPAGATTQTLKYGTDSVTGLSTATLTAAWQTLTVPLTLTATGTRFISFVQGEHPAASTITSDIDVSNFRLMPGVSFPAQVSLAPMPVRFDQANDFAMNASHQLTSSASNAISSRLNGPTNFATWSYLGSLDAAGTIASGAFLSSVLGSGRSGTYLSSFGTTSSSQNLYYTVLSRGYDDTKKFRMALTGLSTFGITYDGTLMNFYHNGLLMCSYVVSHAMANICKIAFGANCDGVASTLLPFTGLRSGETFWGSALTAPQMSAAHSVAVSRLAAKSLTIATQPNVFLCEGDSITTGSGDALAIGYALRAMSMIPGKTLNGDSRAVAGSSLNGSLVPRAAAADAIIARFIAAGKRVIMPVLIGTNDQPATQAAADTYYADLCTYYAARRAAGAKIIASTLIPCTQNAAYDSTSMTAVGGPLNGNTYNGMRNYISARLRFDATKYDALADYAALPELAAWSATYFADTAHPNTAGHAILAAALVPVIQTLLL